MKFTIPYLLISSLMATAAFAQTATRTPPTPAQIAQRQVQMLTNFLGLNSTQQQEALGYFTTAATANAAVEATLTTDRQNLVTAIQTNHIAGIAAAATAIGNATAQITANNATAEAQFYVILTQEQQTKYSQTLTRGGGFGGFGGMGGPFGRGRPQ